MSVLRRVPSRRAVAEAVLPSRAPCDPVAAAAAVVVVLGVLVMLLCVAWPVPVGLAIVIVLASVWSRDHTARMHIARAGESICTFARAFPRRGVDTRILRAVHEELECVGHPIRASDRIEEDLCLVLDDLEDDLPELAHRAGRTLENLASNPLYGRVRTVGDVVAFLQHQPPVGGTPARGAAG